MKAAICYIIALWAVLLCSTTYGEDWSTAVLTNEATDQLEVRVGYDVNADWEVGLLGTWFTEKVEGSEWGIGAYAKMAVDPNASLPIADWLPAIGNWLQLPASLTCETYAIGKLSVVPYDGDAEIAAAVGAGAQIGPACVEWIYNIIEQGGTNEPALSSGAELWFGARLEF